MNSVIMMIDDVSMVKYSLTNRNIPIRMMISVMYMEMYSDENINGALLMLSNIGNYVGFLGNEKVSYYSIKKQ